MTAPQATISDANELAAAARAIREFAGADFSRRIEDGWAIVLGSGLGHVGDTIADAGGQCLSYTEIPAFPGSAVRGHAGRLVCGMHEGVPVIVLQGRAHFYEGHEIATITRPVRALLALGVRRLLLTNASGGINREFRAGDLMLIRDHINRLPAPLGGHRNARVWSKVLTDAASAVGRQIGVPLREGIYAAVSGPNYETPAEVRMLRQLGADAVGMSTVPEAVAAAGGAAVVGISCITNVAADNSAGPITHEEVQQVGRRVRHDFGRLVLSFVQRTSKR